MPRIAGEITIEAPIQEVFDLVADERNEPSYNPRIARVEKEGDDPVGAGTTFRVEPRGLGSRAAMTMVVAEYARPHRLRDLVHAGYLEVDGTLSFTETDAGTRMRWDWDMSLVGPMRLFSPVLALVGPRWERRNWVGLKDYVESGRG